MNHIILGVGLGVVAGAIVVGLMMPMTFPDKRAALMAAFVSRFSIGFLTANVVLPISPIIVGLGVGLVLSIPDALVLPKAYAPITHYRDRAMGGLCGVGVVLSLG